jgi:hypothetical protein
VDDLANRKSIIEQGADSRDRHRRRHCCAQQRHLMMVGRSPQIVMNVPAARNQHAGNIVTEGRVQDSDAGLVRQAIEVAHFALAEYDDAPRTKIFMEPGQGQAGLLDVRAGDSALEPPRAAQELERETRWT